MGHGPGGLFQSIPGEGDAASHHEVDEAGAAAQKSFIELFEAEFLAGVKHDKAEGRHVFVLTKDEGQAGAVACAVSEAVKGLAALFDAVQIVGDDELLVALGHGGVRGNPCLFPARFFPELLELREDHGGNTVIRRHEADLLLLDVPAEELRDVDTAQALEELKAEEQV